MKTSRNQNIPILPLLRSLSGYTAESSTSRRHRFTLIELLVVIAIIALLVAMLLPAVGGVRDMAKKTKARNQIQALVLAVKQFKTTYGLMPGWDNEGTEDLIGTVDTELSEDQYDILVQILSKLDYTDAPNVANKSDLTNERNIVFLGVPNDFASKGYVDPWGNRFVVLMDRNYDRKIDETYPGGNPEVAIDLNGDGDTTDIWHKQVAVYSFGPDGKDGTTEQKSDNLYSWK